MLYLVVLADLHHTLIVEKHKPTQNSQILSTDFIFAQNSFLVDSFSDSLLILGVCVGLGEWVHRLVG